ncbi:MAG: 4-(cytidine 5'-diphospho)-2-C-methyl-D-erythritol kinase [Marinoscillum sp.]
MLSFPNAKINIGLNITSKRPDGYHNIESCFYPIPWYDALEILPANSLQFTTSGLEIPGTTSSNLCIKAYEILKSEYNIGPVHIHLHKVIPMGAGLGGGSADGAFTLTMLNDIFHLNLSIQALRDVAGRLGSDCPFFIENRPAIVRGTGNEFFNCSVNLKGKYLAVRNPGIHISTAEAYRNVVPSIPESAIEEILNGSITSWKSKLNNQFELSIFPNHPQIADIKQELYKHGAIYASMTGSGSTVFGLFDQYPDLPKYRILGL